MTCHDLLSRPQCLVLGYNEEMSSSQLTLCVLSCSSDIPELHPLQTANAQQLRRQLYRHIQRQAERVRDGHPVLRHSGRNGGLQEERDEHPLFC